MVRINGSAPLPLVSKTSTLLLRYILDKNWSRKKSLAILIQCTIRESKDNYPPNLDSFQELEAAMKEFGAAGTGLVRSEYLFRQGTPFVADKVEAFLKARLKSPEEKASAAGVPLKSASDSSSS